MHFVSAVLWRWRGATAHRDVPTITNGLSRARWTH
jgi:hypothetical protein